MSAKELRNVYHQGLSTETEKESATTPEAKVPSSSSTGFFQSPPKLENQFQDDVSLGRVLALYLPPTVRSAIQREFSGFGDKVLSRQVLDWVADAEKNPPFVRTWDTWGKRKDELVTAEGWKRLQDVGISEGIVAIGYEDQFAEFSRLVQFGKYHLWAGSCAYVTCPSAMQDGAARVLWNRLASNNLAQDLRSVLESAYSRLISRDPAKAWTSGQWMTERKGGSDVSGTETLATYSPQLPLWRSTDGSALGPWVLNGFKWFSSATDSAMTVALAQTPRGLSLFYAPVHRLTANGTDVELNGVSIQRLKSKLGTRAVPTAELELKGMRAWLLGEEGKGVKEISAVLNITRVHNSIMAMGMWGRGLAISRAFARVRVAGERKLTDIPLHARTVAKQTVTYRAYMHLTFFVVLLLGLDERPSNDSRSFTAFSGFLPDAKDVPLLLRVLTPITKAQTAKAAIAGMAECMESLGGVGYLENDEVEFNIARLFRDTNVLSIWEGTTDILATDTAKVLKSRSSGKAVVDALSRCFSHVLSPQSRRQPHLDSLRTSLLSSWAALQAELAQADIEELKLRGREVMQALSRLLCGALLVVDAESDGDEVAEEVARRWVAATVAGEGLAGGAVGVSDGWKDEVVWDQRIAFGEMARETARL